MKHFCFAEGDVFYTSKHVLRGVEKQLNEQGVQFDDLLDVVSGIVSKNAIVVSLNTDNSKSISLCSITVSRDKTVDVLIEDSCLLPAELNKVLFEYNAYIRELGLRDTIATFRVIRFIRGLTGSLPRKVSKGVRVPESVRLDSELLPKGYSYDLSTSIVDINTLFCFGYIPNTEDAEVDVYDAMYDIRLPLDMGFIDATITFTESAITVSEGAELLSMLEGVL